MLLLKRPTSWVAIVCIMAGVMFLGGRTARATEAISPISPLAPRSASLFAVGDQAADDEAPTAKRDEPLLTRPATPGEPTPYWKTWWFWTATGIGVAALATVAALVLTYKPDLHSCPPYAAIGANQLGCYGEGR